MARWDAKTVRTTEVPTVVLVGCTAGFLARCRAAAAAVGAVVVQTTVESAATVCAERRPLVLMISDAICAFDPSGYVALARDVRATLVRLPSEQLADAELERTLNEAVRAALRRRADRHSS